MCFITFSNVFQFPISTFPGCFIGRPLSSSSSFSHFLSTTFWLPFENLLRDKMFVHALYYIKDNGVFESHNLYYEFLCHSPFVLDLRADLFHLSFFLCLLDLSADLLQISISVALITVEFLNF